MPRKPTDAELQEALAGVEMTAGTDPFDQAIVVALNFALTGESRYIARFLSSETRAAMGIPDLDAPVDAVRES